MTILIILAIIIVYVSSMIILLHIIAKDGDFDTVGELCGWTYEYYPLVFIPVLNTFVLIISAVVYPCFRIATKIAKIKLPKKKNNHENS